MKDPEDEAFEELTLKQGQWQYTSGWRKKQILETSMTQDDILKKLSDIIRRNQNYTTWTVSTPHLVQLVNSAIEMEREECAKILDANAMACESLIMRSLLQSNAQAIRVRGQA